MASILSGSEIEIPDEIQSVLLPEENVLFAFQQSGLGNLAGSVGGKLTGLESIFVTDNRIIKMTPTTLGLRANITDHLYSDMANANLKKGILATDLFINMRHNPQPFMIKNIPKDGANDILKTIQMGIAGRIGGGKKSQGQSQVVVQEQVDIVDQIKKLSELKNAGILSEDEFETKKKELLAKI